ncbi:hypothetical protein [Brevundimonas diminuta]|uniref:hypothetical protein n=1 Tax=Brevundimonas diminuta TaxID=293 RepID=UPI0025A685BC|nr:hypothetical protein [Brevundimonas diminuta]MDM8353998.1 hypothetical protein [Brevundimonas diminuta]
MTQQSFVLPASVGAADVQVFTPAGETAAEWRLATPGKRLVFDAAASGLFHIRVAPLGETPWLAAAMIDVERSSDLSPVLRRKEALAPESPILPYEFAATDDLLPSGLFTFNTPLKRTHLQQERGLRSLSATELVLMQWPYSRQSSRPRHIAVGLGLDSRPLRTGGWEPFYGPWELTESATAESWTFEIYRGPASAPLAAHNARVRVHFAIEQSRVLRLLVPLFQGGVRVTVGSLNGDVSVTVRPADPNLHMLMQAIGSGSAIESLALLDYVAMGATEEVDQDPWGQAAFGLLALRKHPDAFPSKDAAALADRCPWFADASIIAANLLLADDDPDIAQALRRLSHARKVGAPYFSVSNAMLGDLLVILAADAEAAEHRAFAAQELRLWRKRLPFQAATGPYFAWIAPGGSRNRGRIDARYNRTIFQGLLHENGLSPMSDLWSASPSDYFPSLRVTPRTTIALPEPSLPLIKDQLEED